MEELQRRVWLRVRLHCAYYCKSLLWRARTLLRAKKNLERVPKGAVGCDVAIGDTIRFSDKRRFVVSAWSDDYYLGRWWSWHEYYWRPVRGWYVRSYCRLMGRRWYR